MKIPKFIMDAEEFRKFGYAAVDFVADYLENVHDRFVFDWKFLFFAHNLNIKHNELRHIRIESI